MKVKRPKFSEFHYGRQLFHVSVGPSRDGLKLTCWMREDMCLSRPYDARLFDNEKSPFVRTRETKAFWSGLQPRGWTTSLNDSNVVWNNRNLHRLFTKRKHAERYMARIESGCLNAAERKHFADSVRYGRAY